MAVKNAVIFDRVHAQMTNDYQQRVPLAGGFANPIDGAVQVAKALTDPMNGKLFNEFIDGLITVIGTDRILDYAWRNPLAKFKTDDYAGGKTVRELQVLLPLAQQYDQDALDLLRRQNTDVKTAYYSVNRAAVYRVSINRDMLIRSFNDPESGLAAFIGSVLNSAVLANEYDEYRFMLNAFAAHNQYHPFYNENVTIADVKNPTDTEIKLLSRRIREKAMEIGGFPRNEYNSFGVPAFTRKEDLVLLVTPIIKASMDVEVLADAFNMDKTDFNTRVIVVDELPWAGVHAILLDSRAVVAGDSLFEFRSFSNPQTLVETFFLHAQGGYNISALRNVILFSNAESTQIGVVEVELTGLTAKAEIEVNGARREVDEVRVNSSNTQIVVDGVGTIEGDDKGLFRVPGNWIAEVTVNGSTEPLKNQSTFVDYSGKLHLGDGVAVGDTVTVTVKSAYINPSGTIDQPTSTISTSISLKVANAFHFVEEEEPVEPGEGE